MSALGNYINAYNNQLANCFKEIEQRLSTLEGSPSSYTQDDLPLVQLLDAERRRSASLEQQLSGSSFMVRTTQDQIKALLERVAELEWAAQQWGEIIAGLGRHDPTDAAYVLRLFSEAERQIAERFAERPDPYKSDLKSWGNANLIEYALGLQRTLSEKSIALHNAETALNTLKALREEDVREFQAIEADAELGRLVRAMSVGARFKTLSWTLGEGWQYSEYHDGQFLTKDGKGNTPEEALRAAGVSVATEEKPTEQEYYSGGSYATITPAFRQTVIIKCEGSKAFDEAVNEQAKQEMTKCLACYGWSNKSGCLACKGTGWIVKEEACQ